jgi:hypothetical protein
MEANAAAAEPQEAPAPQVLPVAVAPVVDSTAGKNERPASVTGYVLDEQDRPLAGVRVALTSRSVPPYAGGRRVEEAMAELERQAPDQETVSDEAGLYTFSRVLPVEWVVVWVREEGYMPAQFTAEFRSGLEHTLNLPLKRGNPLHGRVLAADGRPVADGAISLKGYTSVNMATTAGSPACYTDSQGRVVLWVEDIVEEMQGVLRAESPVHGVQTFQHVPLEAEGQFELRYTESAALHGAITTAEGRPAAGYGVRLQGTIKQSASGGGGIGMQGDTYEGVTDTNGNYHLAGIDAAQELLANVVDAEKKVVASGQPLGRLEPGEDREWNHTIEAAATITGVVLGSTGGQPMPNIRVLCQKQEGSFTDYAMTDRDGRFTIAVKGGAGKYLLTPLYDAGGSYSGSDTDRGKAVDVVPGGKLEVELELPETYTRAFRVVDREGQPLRAAVVNITEKEASGGTNSYNSGNLSTGDDGRLTLEGLKPGVSTTVYFERFAHATTASEAVVGEPGEVRPEETVVMQPEAQVRAQLLDEAGLPLADADVMVFVEVEGARELLRVRTDPEGWLYVKDKIPAAPITLQILAGTDDKPPVLSYNTEPFTPSEDEATELGAVRLLPVGE